MKPALTLALGALLTTAAATASPLTPDQALAAARGTATAHRIAGPAVELTLATTVADASGAPTVYVFTGAEGFVIAAADDCVQPLLGFSATSTFDAENIPANVQWWLDQVSAEIAAARPSQAPLRARKDRAAVAPICQTVWNQGAPFNRECPIVGDQRAVTGCVATAAAQIMKVYNWPETGVGSHSYQFTEKGETYTESFNFGATTFVWSNMLNNYPYANSGSTAQRNAVAKLMHACGVASEMSYSADGSGATPLQCGAGMISWLRYDKGMRYEFRDWYTPEGWDDLLYADIAAGHPLFYSGDDGTAGHAFVADGYQNPDLFHINWGWGGYFDGFYLLSDLNPEGTGIGGGSGEAGYTNNNVVLAGIMPEVEGSLPSPVFALTTPLSTTSTRIVRTQANFFTIRGSGYSYSFFPYNFTFGLQLVDESGNTQELEAFSSTLDPYTGYGSEFLNISASRFPVGEYDVIPVYKTGETGWTPMKVLVNRGPSKLHVLVSEGSIAVVDGSFGDDIYATCDGIYVTTSGDEDIYAGHTYRFRYTVSAKTAFEGNLTALLLAGDNTVLATSEAQAFNLEALASETSDFLLTMPEALGTGEYTVQLATGSAGSYQTIPAPVTIEVVGVPLKATYSLTATSPSNNDNELYKGMNNTCTFAVNSNITWEGNLMLRLLKKNAVRYSVVANGSQQNVVLSADGPVSDTWNIDIPESASGTLYVGLYNFEDGDWQLQGTPVKVTVTEAGGVELIGTDAAAPAAYYDIYGRRVAEPSVAGLYIGVDAAGNAVKIVK